MSENKFVINGSITAKTVHVGDKNYYNSAKEFNSANPQLTSEELELVKIIFENTNSPEERQQILESLRSISKGEVIEQEKETIFKTGLDKIQQALIKTGSGVAVKFIVDYLEQRF